jgi:sortase A
MAAAVLIVSGLVTAGVTGWDWVWRVHEIRASQAQLTRDWDGGAGAPARLHLPSLGTNLVVVEGDDDADLLRGPGHMPGTPAFGEPGNTGVAGHRYPGAFWDLDLVRVGDPVVVETRDSWLVYRVDRESVVGPADTGVLAPHPAGAPPAADRFLTLITCDPVFTTMRRLVRQAVLVRAAGRADGVPIELDDPLR